MNLFVSTPFAAVLSVKTHKVHIPTTEGDWCMLPRHADAVFTLEPGIMTYSQGVQTLAAAVNSGLCVKTGSNVMIATNRAVASPHLEDLARAVEEQFQLEADEERRAQTAMAHIEIGIIRHLLELEPGNV